MRNSVKLPADCGVNEMLNVQGWVVLAGHVSGLVTEKSPVVEGVMVTDSPIFPPMLPFSTVKL